MPPADELPLLTSHEHRNEIRRVTVPMTVVEAVQLVVRLQLSTDTLTQAARLLSVVVTAVSLHVA
jgi:hypothetical protein